MQQVVEFGILGLGLGALYALASSGLILIYRGSGILNFAHGAVGMSGAYVYWDISVEHGHSFWLGFLAGAGFSGLVGALTQLLIMRQLRRAAPLARVVVTLGLLIILEWAAILEFGAQVQYVPDMLPSGTVTFDGLYVPDNILILVGISVCLGGLLWALYRYSRFGLATTATAENERAASALGWSTNTIAAVNWTLGSMLAGIAAILVAPIVQLSVTNMTTLVLASLAAALVAGFRSFPIGVLAGLLIGVVQSEVNRWAHVQGLDSSTPFFVIIGVLVFTGRTIPLRDVFLQRWPWVGSGRVRPIPLAAGIVVTLAVIALAGPAWSDAIQINLAIGLVLLSTVVVTGYTGQLSLAQLAFAGFGAWLAGRCVVWTGMPFWAAMIIGTLGTVPLAVLFALPAVRARGINLAVVTLGLASAMELMLFDNGSLTGGTSGTTVPSPSLFGLNVSAIAHSQRYTVLTLAVVVVATLAVANIRRSPTGRRMLAVRTNERAAGALGISVPLTKLYAFGLSGGIAALGGILLAFRQQSIFYTEFSSFSSITYVGFAHIGGIGYLLGPLLGAQLAPGALGTQIGNVLFSGIVQYLQLIGGIFVVLLVLQNQDGMAHESAKQVAWVVNRARRVLGHPSVPETPPAPAVDPAREPMGEPERVAPKVLEIKDLAVHFGGVVALAGVDLRVGPGEIVGLIGPNGAGKTTVIDSITGFVKPTAGEITVDGRPITRMSVAARARLGLSRSFQSLELFEDLTVAENLYAACDERTAKSYVRDLLRPHTPPLPSEVAVAVREFGLEEFVDRYSQDLPYGKRRLLAIARAAATRPSILLLDEPAAGLSEIEAAELAALLRSLVDRWGIGILLVEHHVELVMSTCDRIAVLEFGRCISTGSPPEVRSDPAVIAAYLGTDVPETAGAAV
jgi:sulfate-transporting ATPase